MKEALHVQANHHKMDERTFAGRGGRRERGGVGGEGGVSVGVVGVVDE